MTLFILERFDHAYRRCKPDGRQSEARRPVPVSRRREAGPGCRTGTALARSTSAGATATSAATVPMATPQHDEQQALRRDQRAHVPRGEANCAEQSQLAATLEDVARQHRRQPKCAEQQPERAQRLEVDRYVFSTWWYAASRARVSVTSTPKSDSRSSSSVVNAGPLRFRRFDHPDRDSPRAAETAARIRVSPMISSDCSTLSASVPDDAQAGSARWPSGVNTKSSPTAR